MQDNIHSFDIQNSDSVENELAADKVDRLI